jgi:hypothetical protein
MSLRESLIERGWDLVGHPPLRIVSAKCPVCGEVMHLVSRVGEAAGACIVCDAPVTEDDHGPQF